MERRAVSLRQQSFMSSIRLLRHIITFIA